MSDLSGKRVLLSISLSAHQGAYARGKTVLGASMNLRMTDGHMTSHLWPIGQGNDFLHCHWHKKNFQMACRACTGNRNLPLAVDALVKCDVTPTQIERLTSLRPWSDSDNISKSTD